MARARSIAIALAVALAAASSGYARAEWRLSGVFSETVETVTDRELDGENAPAFGSTTVLRLSVEASEPIMAWSFDAGLTGAKFAGPGAQDDFDRLDPSFATSFSRRGQRLTLDFDASLDVQPTSSTQIEDTGVTNEDTSQYTALSQLSFGYDLSPLEKATLAFDTRVVEFDDRGSNLTPTRRAGATLTYRRRETQRLTGVASAGASYLIAEDDDDTRTTSARLSLGADYDVTPRFDVGGTVGPSLRYVTKSDESSALDFSANGDLSANWRPDAVTSLALTLAQGFETSSDGVLEAVGRLNFNAVRSLAPDTTLSFGLRYLRRQEDTNFAAADADREVINATPTLAYFIDRSWRATAGYTLTVSRDEGEDAVSNRLFFTLSTEF